jgi:hypothetical protein
MLSVGPDQGDVRVISALDTTRMSCVPATARESPRDSHPEFPLCWAHNFRFVATTARWIAAADLAPTAILSGLGAT